MMILVGAAIVGVKPKPRDYQQPASLDESRKTVESAALVPVIHRLGTVQSACGSIAGAFMSGRSDAERLS